MLRSRDGDYTLQPSLAALKASAEIGCDFCRLVYLGKVNRSENIEAHLRIPAEAAANDPDVAVKVAAQLEDGLRLGRETDETLLRPQIYVRSGRSVQGAVLAVPYVSSSLSVFARLGEDVSRSVDEFDLLRFCMFESLRSLYRRYQFKLWTWSVFV